MNPVAISPALQAIAAKPAPSNPSQSAVEDAPRFSELLSRQHAAHKQAAANPDAKDTAARDTAANEKHDPAGQAIGNAEEIALQHAGEAGIALNPDIIALTTATAPAEANASAASQLMRLADTVSLNGHHGHIGAGKSGIQPFGIRTADAQDKTLAQLIQVQGLPGQRPGAADTSSHAAPRIAETLGLHQTANPADKAKQTLAANAVRTTLASAIKVGLATEQDSSRSSVAAFSNAMVDAATHAQFRSSMIETADPSLMDGPTHSPLSNGTLMQALAGSSAPASASMVTSPGVGLALNSPNWAGDFGRQFVNLTQNITNGSQTAELRLDPPELGPLRITISISDNVAHASFSSPHAVVRQTVENALPQLQQLLSQAGISLGQTSVSDQGQAGQSAGDGDGNRSSQGRANTSGSAGPSGVDVRPPVRARIPDALVDTFA